MSGNEEQPRAKNPVRRNLVLKLAGVAAFVIILGTVAVWMIAHFVHELERVAINLPDATPPGAVAAPGQLAISGTSNISGNVVDAVTHQPVAAFNARVGYGIQQGQVQSFTGVPKDFTGGQFRMSSARTNGNQQSLVRIEAHGYLPAVLEVQGSDPLNFALTPAQDLLGRVLSADGTPQAGVTVEVALPGLQMLISSDPKLMAGGSNTETLTGADGTYDLPPQSGHFILAAVGAEGFAQADQDTLAKSTDLHLAAWGRLVGKMMFETKPAAGVQMAVDAGAISGPANEPRIYQSVSVKTADNGTFTVDKIGLAPVRVTRVVTHQGAQMRYGQTEALATLKIAPGETATLNLGGAGRPVVGKLLVPAGMNVNDYLISAYATGTSTADFPALMPDDIKHAPPGPRQLWMRSFLQTPDGHEYQKSHPDAVAGPHRYMLVIDEQNRFRMENVPPGDYLVNVNLQTTQGAMKSSMASAKFTMPDIPGGVSDEPLEIADIPISVPRSQAGPQGSLSINGLGGANQPAFTGNVVDAQTHQPVNSFMARVGFVFIAKGPVNYQDPPQQFTGGQYKLISNRIGQYPGWYVRVEAHGYLPAVSPPMSGPGTQDFELTAAKDLQGTVFSPDGKPAAGATLIVAVPGVQANVSVNSNGPMMNPANVQTTTDAEGRYDLPPQSGHFAVAAYAPQGYARRDQDALAQSGDIHLAAWGRVEGKVMFGTRPAAEVQLAITAGNSVTRTPIEPAISFRLESMSGPDGAFSVDQVPPGIVQIARQVTQSTGAALLSASDEATTVTVGAGETAQVIVGGVGRPVEGKLIFPPGTSADDYSLNGSAVGGVIDYPPQMPEDVKTADFAAKLAWMRVFAQSQAGREFLKAHPVMTQKRYAMELEADQKFRLVNVMPGDYMMMINIQSRLSGQQGSPAQATFTMPDVPGGVSDEPLVIPDIKIP